jgi:ABC-2 type transport system ATP-binding protein
VTHAIEIEGVVKTFGRKVAVRDLDLVVPEGSLHGFIGPNGAGKTTTIRMVMSIIFPDRGDLKVLGKGSAIESKDRIGYLPEERGVYRKMKVGAFLRYMAMLKGHDSGPALTRKIRDWLERVELADVERKKCEELSKGMQQKVQFLSTILHEPDLLILDEPFSGLDPVNMRLMRDLFLEQHRAGRTIIFSTHVMHQAEQLCQHIVMINRGRKVLDAPIEDVYEGHEAHFVHLDPIPGLETRPDGDALLAIDGVIGVEEKDKHWEIALAVDADQNDVMRRVLQVAPARRIEVPRPTLEDVFVDIVQGGGAREPVAEEVG